MPRMVPKAKQLAAEAAVAEQQSTDVAPYRIAITIAASLVVDQGLWQNSVYAMAQNYAGNAAV